MLFSKAESIFRGSSVVEQVTVNHLVVGSSPTPGAINKTINFVLVVLFITLRRVWDSKGARKKPSWRRFLSVAPRLFVGAKRSPTPGANQLFLY